LAASNGSITLSNASIVGVSVKRLPLMKNVGVALTPNVSLARLRWLVMLSRSFWFQVSVCRPAGKTLL